jgi:predicted transposase YbfD/YdcC
MASDQPTSSHDHSRGLIDPRLERTRGHPLINVVFIAVRGIPSGADSFAAIQEFGGDRGPWSARCLDLANGIPSDDTFARGLARLDPAAFEKGLLAWIHAVREITAGRPIAIDGETLRGSHDRGDGRAAIHMASAWAVENGLSLGRVVVVDEESNAITATPELLRVLEVSGALVTIDAMGRQREIAGLIRAGGGGDVPAVKPNRPPPYQQAEGAIDAGLERDAAAPDGHRTVETGHGRHGRRTDAALPAPGPVDPDGLWRGLNAVGMAITASGDSRGRRRSEVRYSTLSVLLSSKEFADAVRGHWSIENDLHWQLDVSFREDECRVGTDHAPANPSVIRRFALGLLRREASCRRGIETKRLKGAASDEYREKALFNT